jgi:transposase
VAALSVQDLLRCLLSIQGLRVRGAHLETHGVVVDVAPRQHEPRCGMCGRLAPGYDTGAQRRWRHLALGQFVFWLCYGNRSGPQAG